MKMKELREKSNAELDKLLAQKRSVIQDARFASAGQRLKKVREVREAKKDIAKILTLQSEQGMKSNGPNQAEEINKIDSVKVEKKTEKASAGVVAKSETEA